MTLWLLVLLMGAGTYAIRLSMLVVVHHRLLPAAVRDALRFVMPAVLAAIVLPAVLYSGGGGAFDAGIGNERVPAAIIAAAFAGATERVWPTIAVGMAALWLLQWAG